MRGKNKISYEPKADVLTMEISGQPIDHAKEIGNIVVHFTKNDVPVLVEILEASKFFRKAKNLLERKGVLFEEMATVSRS